MTSGVQSSNTGTLLCGELLSPPQQRGLSAHPWIWTWDLFDPPQISADVEYRG